MSGYGGGIVWRLTKKRVIRERRTLWWSEGVVGEEAMY